MRTEAYDVEALLRRAFTPIEPPERLDERLESTLQTLADAAAEELEGWELSAMRDPRNWVRPAVATAVGASAGTALVILRVRSGQRKRLADAVSTGDQLLRVFDTVSAEARRRLQRESD